MSTSEEALSPEDFETEAVATDNAGIDGYYLKCPRCRASVDVAGTPPTVRDNLEAGREHIKRAHSNSR